MRGTASSIATATAGSGIRRASRFFVRSAGSVQTSPASSDQARPTTSSRRLPRRASSRMIRCSSWLELVVSQRALALDCVFAGSRIDGAVDRIGLCPVLRDRELVELIEAAARAARRVLRRLAALDPGLLDKPEPLGDVALADLSEVPVVERPEILAGQVPLVRPIHGRADLAAARREVFVGRLSQGAEMDGLRCLLGPLGFGVAAVARAAPILTDADPGVARVKLGDGADRVRLLTALARNAAVPGPPAAEGQVRLLFVPDPFGRVDQVADVGRGELHRAFHDCEPFSLKYSSR